MTSLHKTGNGWIRELLGPSFTDSRITPGHGDEYSIAVTGPEFLQAAETLALHKFSLSGLFAVEGFSGRAGYSLFSIFEKKEQTLVLIREVSGNAASIAGLFASASWYER